MTEISSVDGDVQIPELGIEVELQDKFDTLHSEAKEAITNEEYDKAIELLVELDQTPIEDSAKSGKFIELATSLWRKNASQGDRLVGLISNNYTFSLDKDLVRYEGVRGRSGYFSVERKPTPEGRKHLQEAYSLFIQKEDEKFAEHLQKALQLIETQDIPEKTMMRFVTDLAWNNIVALEQFFPILSETFQIRLEEDTLFIRGSHASQSLRSDRFLLRDYNVALDAIGKEENLEDQLHLILLIAKMHDSKREELLKMAHNAFEASRSADEKISTAFQLANFYMSQRQAAPLKQIVAEAEIVIEGQERWTDLMSLISFKVEASLIEQNQADFDAHLSAMKTLLPKVTDPEDREDIVEDIQDMESRGNKLFGVDPLTIQAERV